MGPCLGSSGCSQPPVEMQHPVEMLPSTLEILPNIPWRCSSAPQGDALDPVMLLPLPLPSKGMLLAAGGFLACAAAPWHRQGGISQLPDLIGMQL